MDRICIGDATVEEVEMGACWAVGTAGIRREIAFKEGHLFLSALLDPVTSSQWHGPDGISDEFLVVADGKEITGRSPLELVGAASRRNEMNAAELVLSVRERETGLIIHLHYVAYPRTTVMERWLVLENSGNGPVVLDRMDSVRLILRTRKRPFRLHYLGSQGAEFELSAAGWGTEFELRSIPWELGRTQVISSKSGHSTETFTPWFTIEDPHRGEGLFGGLAWSGNWQIRFDRSESQNPLIEGGLHEFGFKHRLEPGTSVQSPRALLGCFQGDLDDASNELHFFQTRYLVPVRDDPHLPPVTLTTFFAAMDSFNDGSAERYLDIARDIGVEIFDIVTDWNRGLKWADWLRDIGHWHENPGLFPEGGLVTFSQEVRKRGMGLGVFTEPEHANPNTPVYSAHPEWMGDTPATDRLLCLANPQVAEWVRGELDRVATIYRPRLLMFDFNLTPGAGCTAERHGHQEGDGLYRHYMNLYDVWEWIRRRHPDLRIRNCASGGMRMDFATIRYSDFNWISDVTHPVESLRHIYGMTYAFPAQYGERSATNVPNASPEGTPREKYFDYRFRTAMMGSFTISARLWDWSEPLVASAKKNIALFKELRPLIRESRIYHLTPQAEGIWFDRDEPMLEEINDVLMAGDYHLIDDLRPPNLINDWMVMEYIDWKGKEGVVFAFRNDNDRERLTAKLRGLDSDAAYRVLWTDSGQEMSIDGSELMEKGIEIHLPYRFSSEIVRFETDRALEGRPEPETPVRRFEPFDSSTLDGLPPQVTGLHVRAVAPNEQCTYKQIAELTWDPPPQGAPVHHFEVHRSANSGFKLSAGTFRIYSAIPRFIDFSLEPDTEYYYRVIAVSANEKRGSPSAEAAVKTGKS